MLAAVGLLICFWSARAAPLQNAKPITAPEIVLTLDPAQTAVHYTVDSTLHTVHGTFELTRGTVQFDPETDKASGEIPFPHPAVIAATARAMLACTRKSSRARNIPK